MRSVIAVVSFFMAAAVCGPVLAADCPGNPNALGVSRVLVVDPTEHPVLGELSYRESLPLNDHEVVLTFDDGPLPPYTSRILDILKHECVKATFFMVGRMAHAYPHMVKRVFEEGHTLANHSESHPFTFHRMSVERAAQEIEGGFHSIRTALGDPNGVAPFFRFPGLLHQPAVERYLRERAVQAWSVDVVADDWTHINNREIVRRAMKRLEARRKGILLLHDIQPATALGLADLLAQLKAGGFKIVQVVPASPDRAKTPTTPDQWMIHHRHEPPSIWPEPEIAALAPSKPELEIPSPQSFGVTDTPGVLVPVAFGAPAPGERSQDGVPLPPVSLWPRAMPAAPTADSEILPAPAPETFRYSRVWRPHMRVRATHRLTSHKTKSHKTASHGTASHGTASRKTASHKDGAADDITNSIAASPRPTVSLRRSAVAAPATGLTNRTHMTREKRAQAVRPPSSGHQIELPSNPTPTTTVVSAKKPTRSLLDLFR
jgi:peptidoglycan/xylan/chitin deacetylase (PgdA/CDA1 family)